jgi:predicted MFS family arabinose efflux permease
LHGSGIVRSANSVLAVVTISHLMQHIYLGISILFPLIIADLNLSYTEFGLIIAISSLIGGILQIGFSVLSRKIARHILLGLGNILLSLGTFLTSFAYNFLHFLYARLIASIGIAPQHPMGTAIISERFDSKSIGKAIGIHFGLAYIGNIIGPLFMTILAIVVGWRNTLMIFSIPVLIVGFTTIWYLSEGKKVVNVTKRSKIPSLKSDVVSVIRTKSVIPIIITQTLISGGTDLGIIVIYTPLFLADALKLNVFERGIVYTIALVGGVLGPVTLGRYADKFGHLKTATLSTLIAVISVYLLSFYDSANLILVFHLFILGFASFALPTLLQTHLVKITKEFKRDLVVGMFFTISFGFGSLWAGIMGYIIDTYSFSAAFMVMGTLGLIAFIILAEQTRRFKKLN